MNLRRWTNRSKLSAGHLNEGVDALNSILTQPDALVRKLGEGGRERRFDIIIGKTTDTGPAGQPDGTGEVYWVIPQYVLPADAIDDPLTFNDEVPIQAGEGDALPDTIAVTNLAEWLDGTHNLPIGTPVLVLPVYERKTNPKIRYVMSAGGTASTPGGAELLYVVAPVTSRTGAYYVQVCAEPDDGVSDAIDFNVINGAGSGAWTYNDTTNGASVMLNPYEINGAGTALDLTSMTAEERTWMGVRKGMFYRNDTNESVPYYFGEPLQFRIDCDV
jgi:hypothetical protein